MHGNAPATIRIVADAGAIGAAMAATHRFIATRRLSDDLAVRLAIVVEELVTNLIDHGEASGARANIRLRPRDGGVALWLLDRGAAFDLVDSVASDLPPERGGGAGLRLVKAWATVEAFRRVGNVNRLQLFLAGHEIMPAPVG